MSVKKENGETLGIRRGIPVALIIIFTSALLFQLFLFSYAVNTIWRNYTAGFITLLSESLSKSVQEIFRVEGRSGIEGLTSRLEDSYPGLTAKELVNRGDMGGSLFEGLTERQRKALGAGSPISFSKRGKGFVLIPVGGSGPEESIYLFTFDFQGFAHLDRLSIIIGLTSFLYILVLFVFTYIVFRNRITHPLSNLLSVVGKVEEGDRETRVRDMPPNELGRLGDVLNNALDMLEGRRRDLEHMVETLAKTNEELKSSRAQVIRAEKMATIGRLSSGMAHEVGNPLMAIKGYVAHLLRNTEVNEEQKDCLERVHDESGRIEGILRGLLAHTRIDVREGEEADVRQTIEDILDSITYRKVCEGIELVRQLKPVSKALIDPGKLRQVLLNILMNGIDAMPAGGKLTVRTYMERNAPDTIAAQRMRRRKTDPPESDYFRLRENLGMRKNRPEVRFVVVEIEDTGTGIREEDRERVFDPFFTTKDPGKGTGLGLSVTSAILDSYNGRISFESKEGRGSLFRVFIPSSSTNEYWPQDYGGGHFES